MKTKYFLALLVSIFLSFNPAFACNGGCNCACQEENQYYEENEDYEFKADYRECLPEDDYSHRAILAPREEVQEQEVNSVEENFPKPQVQDQNQVQEQEIKTVSPENTTEIQNKEIQTNSSKNTPNLPQAEYKPIEKNEKGLELPNYYPGLF